MERLGLEHHSTPLASGTESKREATTFEDAYASFVVGEVNRISEGGARTVIRAYELIVDPTNQSERRGLLVTFCLRAAQAGYRQALGSVTLPDVGYKDQAGQQPLTGVYFFLEESPPEPSA